MHVRVCVDCGEEYRPDIATCADCGGQLEDQRGDGASPSTAASAAANSGADGAPDSDFTESVLHAEKATELAKHADRLVVAGVPFRMRPARTAGYRLLVAPADTERALALLGLLAERGDATTEGVKACPACETAVAPGAMECAECGLTVGDEAEPLTCDRCGRSLDGPACPDCGR